MLDTELAKQALTMTFTVATLRTHCENVRSDLERRANNHRAMAAFEQSLRQSAAQMERAEKVLAEMESNGMKTLELIPMRDPDELSQQILKKAPVYA